MKEAIAIKFKQEYSRLRAKRSGVDYELAKLAHDIRAQFPNGDDGTAQAVDWVCKDLGLQAAQGRSFLGDGEAWGFVRSVDHWIAIGGLGSARLISALGPKQRMVVLAEAVAIADKRKRPITRTQVRDIAWKHGFVEKEPAKVTEAKKAAVLIAFVNRLYALRVEGLPPMPADVRAIVTTLSVAAKKAA